MKQKNSKNAGFSLIEVIFAMLFLTIVVFGMLKLQTSNLVLSHTQQNQLKAHFYLSQALEIAQSLGADAFKACQNTCHLILNGQNYGLKMDGVENMEEGLFQRSFSTQAIPPAGILVTGVIKWTDGSGEHQIEAKRVVY